MMPTPDYERYAIGGGSVDGLYFAGAYAQYIYTSDAFLGGFIS